jgi:hypothetical protein
MTVEVLVTVMSDGNIKFKDGVSVGQILDALEAARRGLLGVTLRSATEEPTPIAD